MHFARLANTLLKDEESAGDNHVFACNFAKYSPILIFFHSQKASGDIYRMEGDIKTARRIQNNVGPYSP